MSANPHAGLPITDDNAHIEAMLADLSMPTPMLCLLQRPRQDPHSEPVAPRRLLELDAGA